MNILCQYLEHALKDAGRIELRQVEPGSMRAGIFDRLEALVDAASAIADSSTVFASLNAPTLRPTNNRMKRGRFLRDEDIGHVVRLPFDFDPVRERGVNSTEAEVKQAEDRRDQFVAAMTKRGFPAPLMGMSGNGAHAVYRCALPATRELRDMFGYVYEGLFLEFSDALVKFDKTVRNPARPWRIYGTVNRKNPETPGRPHRTATCCIPEGWEYVPERVLEGLANECAQRKVQPFPQARELSGKAISGTGDYRTLDAVAWFKAHDRYRRWLCDDKHAVACPWEHEHTVSGPVGDTVIYERRALGWPAFCCLHSHCAERKLIDVMRLWGDADRFCERQYRTA